MALSMLLISKTCLYLFVSACSRRDLSAGGARNCSVTRPGCGPGRLRSSERRGGAVLAAGCPALVQAFLTLHPTQIMREIYHPYPISVSTRKLSSKIFMFLPLQGLFLAFYT